MAAVRARSAATRLLMLQLHNVSNGPSGEPAAPTAEFIKYYMNIILLFPMLQLHIVSNGPSGSLPRRLRSLLLLFPMFQLRSASNGPSV